MSGPLNLGARGGKMGRGLGVADDRRAKRQRYDAARREEQPWRKWYKTPTWRRLRRNQLRAEPFCKMCAAAGIRRVATVCDHVNPHRGIWAAFFGGPFQSLCKPHHDGAKQQDEKTGFSRQVDNDGWPTDPAHPFNAT